MVVRGGGGGGCGKGDGQFGVWWVRVLLLLLLVVVVVVAVAVVVVARLSKLARSLGRAAQLRPPESQENQNFIKISFGPKQASKPSQKGVQTGFPRCAHLMRT